MSAVANARERQIADALKTRERQVEREERIEQIADEQPIHHGYAVEVKQRRYFCECDVNEIWSGGACECGFEDARRIFWEDCEELAKQHGFEGVHAAGRMGGYVVPYPEPRTDDMWEHEVEEWMRETFAPFAIDVLANLADATEAWARGELVDGTPVAELLAERNGR